MLGRSRSLVARRRGLCERLWLRFTQWLGCKPRELYWGCAGQSQLCTGRCAAMHRAVLCRALAVASPVGPICHLFVQLQRALQRVLCFPSTSADGWCCWFWLFCCVLMRVPCISNPQGCTGAAAAAPSCLMLHGFPSSSRRVCVFGQQLSS